MRRSKEVRNCTPVRQGLGSLMICLTRECRPLIRVMDRVQVCMDKGECNLLYAMAMHVYAVYLMCAAMCVLSLVLKTSVPSFPVAIQCKTA